MIKVDLKGNVKELEAGVTAAEVAKSIGIRAPAPPALTAKCATCAPR